MTHYSHNLNRLSQLALLVCVGLFSGCASQTAVLSGYSKPTAVPTFKIVDTRPASERDTEFLSLATSSCDYGVRQVGDKDVVPDRIALLRDDLNAALGGELIGKQLLIGHYGIYFNVSTAALNSRGSSGGGLIGAVVAEAMFKKTELGSRCKPTEMKGGWFEASETATPYSPFIVEITLQIDGQTHSVRSVYSPAKELTPAFGNRDTAAAVFAAIRKATDNLILSLRQT